MLAQTPQRYLHRLNRPPLPPPLPVISHGLLGPSPRTTGADDVLDGFVTGTIWATVGSVAHTPLSIFNPGSRSAQQLTEPPRTDPNTNPPSPNRYPPLPPTLTTEHENENHGAIHRLMQSPVLYDPLWAPWFPIILCLGLYGFNVHRPPSLHMQYWSSILGILRKIVSTKVIVTVVPGTGSIASSSEQLDRFLQAKAPRHGINFMAHLMGGLDCRHLITPLKLVKYTPLSLTTIATPHRGSPFMDWCKVRFACSVGVLGN
ncbi:hypothetical protein EI94DRAFT_1820381 [Lactarius quietus]|nr:hypothetical protein EI94DRAFT_1820381 [Lactarius quietus]